MLIPIHDRFFIYIYIYSVKLRIVHMWKINLPDKTLISRENNFCKHISANKEAWFAIAGTWRTFAAATFRSLATARLARESLPLSRARLSCINAWRHKWEGRTAKERGAARMRWMKSQEGETHGAGKRHRRVAWTGGGRERERRRKRGDFTSGRRMKRSWFVSA